MEIRTQKYVARILVVTLATMASFALIQAPAIASDAPPELPPNPYLAAHSSNVVFYPVAEYNGRDSMRLDIDVDVSIPGGCPEGYTCKVVVQHLCLEATGGISWTNYNGQKATFTESEFHVRFSPGFYSIVGCGPTAVAHINAVDVTALYSTGQDAPASELYLVEYNDFPLRQFADALVDVAGEDHNFAGQCENLGKQVILHQACASAAGVVGASLTLDAYRITAAILSAGGTTEDLLALLAPLAPAYVDPIPPPPAGHEIVDGYDLDAIAANIDDNGGLSTLAVLVNAIPCRNSNGGSTTDCAEAVLAGEASGLTTRQVIGALVTTFGAGILMAIVAGVIGPSHGHAANPTTPAPHPRPPTPRPHPSTPRPHPSTPPTGGNTHAPTTTIEPDESSVNEVLRSWYLRIHAGQLGPSTVVATITDPSEEESLRAAARTCLKQASSAAKAGATFTSANPCRDMPILFPAGSADGTGLFNAYEAAQHDAEAILGRPEWFQLNYMSSAAKAPQTPPRWYKAQPYWSVSGCNKMSSYQACDEYPFYSTAQGGPVKFGGSGASLKPVDSSQNSVEGSVLGAMVNTGICHMESALPVPRGTPATGGTPFLVIPMPGVPLPTFFLC